MKSIHLLFYCLVSTLLLASLPACTSKYTKGSVRFSAASSDFGTQTRVSYGEDVNKFIKLNWEEDDQIRISSKQAYIEGTDKHAWTYTITDTYNKENVPQYSYGHLSPAGQGGLVWEENTPKVDHEFWALYPANNTLNEKGEFTATIPNTTKYPQYPDLWMVAHTVGTEGNEPGKTITLYFYPAFTDVRLELNCAASIEETVTLQSCTLSSTDNTFLSGTFDAQICTFGEREGNGIEFEPYENESYTNVFRDCTGVSNEDKGPNGLIINKVGSPSVSVDIICLPFETKTNENIKLTCDFTIGTEKYSKSIEIPGYLFKPRRQNRLKGLVLPSDLKLIDFTVVSCGQHSDGQHHPLPDMTL